jgi:hypothetical protein
MDKDKKITKFSIGKFTNGAYVICGFIINGKVIGIITKTNYNNVYGKFSFVRLPEFHNPTDLVPQFKKKVLFKFLKFLNSYDVNYLTDFLTEMSDLPTSAWRYKDVINKGKRTVIIEKVSRKNILCNYANIDSESELMLVKMISKKYGKKLITDVYVSTEAKKGRGDIYDNECIVSIPSIHNTILFVELNTYSSMKPLYQMYVDLMHTTNGVDKEFKNLVNKIS